ncbi:hypothetical protein GCM10010116_35950 [Microbispora rosea subsp. aerata]|nr:DUF5947 family protein [Microbispora rosea]GGO17787.1 hypothetical protein GCM10010116_35950 [Microbispora rosea subsp. aerata]GIH56609.1 hypothetical protein Mro02_35230 [Microbispora rosea subsp. aerata]GLJ81862.1 hypothetical protein GCM10017588_05870 [Microbispora rosea subsp. aerata]
MSTGLRRFREPGRAPGRAVARCEMCADPVEAEHGHVVDLETRALMCVCRGCRLLFTGPARGRYRAVPGRYRYAPSFRISPADWDELGIPVRTAFFFHNSSLGRTVAFYPSPAGATESLLPLATWDRVLAANPAPADAEPDVEALLVDRAPDGSFSCHLVPIDACYRLVGLVRLHWKGFDGGREAWEAIDGFFAGLRRRARVPKEV